MSLNIGRLDREFVLKRPIGDTDEFATVETVWGCIRLAGGNEILRFSTPESTGTHVVTIRYRDDLRAAWQLVEADTGRVLQITSFGDPDGSAEQLRVFCTELL